MAIGLFNIGNYTNIQNIKKSLEEKNQERTKLYGFIGMETYDLYKQGKVNVMELDSYMESMENLENEIEKLERQIKEEQGKKTNICSCGATVLPKAKFCSKCGKPVEQKNSICECGKKLEEDMMFCPNCGKSVNGAESEIIQETPQYKECVCGAKILEGQTLCMECGREIRF